MREKLINYYENSRSHYTSYHNHKEISAWAGLVLFVTFSGFVCLINLPKGLEILAAAVISLIILVVWFIVYQYISTQLKMKDMAGAYVAASIEIVTDLIAGNIDDDELISYLKVEKSNDSNAQSRHVLPVKFCKKAEILNTRGRGFQDTTRAMIYSILCLTSLSLIAAKWIQVIN